MSRARVAAAAVVALALAALALAIHEAARPAPTAEPRPAPAAPPRSGRAPSENGAGAESGDARTFTTNEACAGCHAEVAEACAKDQHARAWFNGPLFPQDPRRTECASCHAPRPILEVGLDQPATVRATRHEEGVGCIACHRDGRAVRGPYPAGPAPCNPVQDPRYLEVQVCAPCHARHGTIREWQASRFAREGVSCQACHMPRIERRRPDGTTRRVRSHRMRSGRDPAFLRGAIETRAAVRAGLLTIEIETPGVGHSFPGEIFNREAVLTIEVLGPGDAVLATHRESMRAAERSQRTTDPGTQIRSGETRRYRYPLPATARRARIVFGYKLFFLDPDRKAMPIWTETLEIP